MIDKIKTFGELKKANYKSLTVKDELRKNLSQKLKSGEKVFKNIIGYEDSVIPELERAVLAGHSINFLGLRGQGKTKMARLLVDLLDDYIPIIEGTELNEDPFNPISKKAKRILEEMGDKTPIAWWHKSDRYAEKLATPDVNVADLIGDLDPIKAANLRLSLSDDEVINYGIIPRSNRGIFVINELPDLQPRIQVSLFNLLQEGDIQIRGFKLRMPIDIQFIFTSNPEDYTNRGAIITPLKDRIQSQIYTHYPESNELGRSITKQEVTRKKEQEAIEVPLLIEKLIEQVAIEARKSEFVDIKSGVSARLPISAYQNILSAVERRMLINGSNKGRARITDLNAIIPAVIGKIEMVYEGEQEGAINVAHHLIAQAIQSVGKEYFEGLQLLNPKKASEELREEYSDILKWFDDSNKIDLLNEMPDKDYEQSLKSINGLQTKIKANNNLKEDEYLLMEFLLHILSTYEVLDKKLLKKGALFQDSFHTLLGGI